jgi:mannose-1-phosphate guanylyltransferase
MKALILVGGFGTRLRPLTFSCPKPLVEFANKPIVSHQVEALVNVGVKEIVLAISYQPQTMFEYIKKAEEQYGVKITCSIETEPMGTAGPLKLAQDILTKDNDSGLFFVFNSDVICEFPLDKMVEFHKSHGKEGTIMLTQVEDPSKYGVVVYEPDGLIKQFIEKPKEFISNKINAGLYLFNTDILKRIEMKPTSIEREIFPKMASDHQLYSMILEGFWMDIGQPKDFLIGNKLYLNSLRKKNENMLAKGDNIIGNVLIDPTAKVHSDAILGPDVTIGPGVVIEEGARLQRTSVFKDAHVKAHAWVSDTILGWQSVVGKWVRIEGITVLAEDVVIKDEIFINGALILPHKSVTTSLMEKGQIIM